MNIQYIIYSFFFIVGYCSPLSLYSYQAQVEKAPTQSAKPPAAHMPYVKLNNIIIDTTKPVFYTFDPYSSYLLRTGTNTLAHDFPSQSFALKSKKDDGFLSEDNTLTIKPKSAASKQNTVTITYEGDPTTNETITFSYNDITANGLTSYDVYFQKTIFEHELKKLLPSPMVFENFGIDLAFTPDGTPVTAPDVPDKDVPIALIAFHIFFTIPPSNEPIVTNAQGMRGIYYNINGKTGTLFAQQEGTLYKLSFPGSTQTYPYPDIFKALYEKAIIGMYKE